MSKCKSYTHFFKKNISIYAIFNDQSFTDMLTNAMVSFEQLGPDLSFQTKWSRRVCVQWILHKMWKNVNKAGRCKSFTSLLIVKTVFNITITHSSIGAQASNIRIIFNRPQWLSWMRSQLVIGRLQDWPPPAWKLSSWRVIMKYFLWSFSPFSWFKKGSCQFLAKECVQYWLTA